MADGAHPTFSVSLVTPDGAAFEGECRMTGKESAKPEEKRSPLTLTTPSATSPGPPPPAESKVS